jgi:hypothetical protein
MVKPKITKVKDKADVNIFKPQDKIKSVISKTKLNIGNHPVYQIAYPRREQGYTREQIRNLVQKR